MELYVVDAFTSQMFEGNQAGVALLKEDQAFPQPEIMRKIAGELKHSETAFVKPLGEKQYHIRYFTAEGEINLCGHATVSSFVVMRDEKQLPQGDYSIRILAGTLAITVEAKSIWMEMASGELVKWLTPEESEEIYAAYGLTIEDRPQEIFPGIASTGLADILLPVNSREALSRAVQNREKVIALSKRYQVVGVHMFYLAEEDGVTAECRNFAPAVGVDEESATGTANGALTYLLFTTGLVKREDENIFIQGTGMGKPSVIRSKIAPDETIFIGGDGVVSIRGEIDQ